MPLCSLIHSLFLLKAEAFELWLIFDYYSSILIEHQTDIINGIVFSWITLIATFAKWTDRRLHHIELCAIINHWLTYTIMDTNRVHISTTIADSHKVSPTRLGIHMQINQPIRRETDDLRGKFLWATQTRSWKSYHTAITSIYHLIYVAKISQRTKVSILSHLLPLRFILTIPKPRSNIHTLCQIYLIFNSRKHAQHCFMRL